MVTIQPFGPAKGRVSNDSVAARRVTAPYGGWTAEKRDGTKRVDVLRWPILNVNCRKDGVRGQQQPLANCDTERKTEEDEWVSVEEAHWTFTDHLAIYTHCKPVCLMDAYQYTRRMVDDALSLLMAVYDAYIFNFHSYSCIRTFWSPTAAERPPWSHDHTNIWY